MVADRVLTLALVVLSGVAVLGAIFAPQIMRLYLSASHATDKEAQIELGAFFLRWFMPQIVFYGVGAVATGLLQAERKFAAPMFAPILNNLCVIATFGIYALLVGGGTTSVESITFLEKTVLAAGTTFGVAAMTLALWPSLRSLGFRWHLRFDWNHPGGATAGQARAVGRRLRRGEPGGLRRDHGVHRQVRRRLPDLRERVHPLPAPARDRGRVDLHRAPAADVRPMGRTRHRRAPHAVLPRGARHDRRHRAGGARLPGARRPHREPAPATRPRRRERRREHRTHPAGVRASGCRSSRRSNC